MLVAAAIFTGFELPELFARGQTVHVGKSRGRLQRPAVCIMVDQTYLGGCRCMNDHF